MSTPRLLAFSGSLRRGSFNHRIVEVAAAAAQGAGATVTVVRLADHPMPLFDEDLEREQGQPAGALAFKRLLLESAGVLIASPEYNSGYPAALKNASPGALGGIRMLPLLRLLLSNIGMLVVPEQAAVGAAHQQFDPAGAMTDPKLRGMVQSVGVAVARLAMRPRGGES